MARDLNKVQMTGRLGADPELRHTPQGHTVTTFRVASNRSWRTSEGEAHEDTEWFRVVAWNRLAEVCRQYLAKGTRVYVEGRLQTRQWQDADGQPRSMTEVVASDMIILDRRDSPSSADEGAPVDAAPAPHSNGNAPHAAPLKNGWRAARTAPLPTGDSAVVESDLPF